MNNYCIIYIGLYADHYSYVKKENISQLAKYLNEQLSIFKGKRVKAVFITNEYFSLNLDPNFRCFLPTEYKNQHFLETYEERLLAKHCEIAV